MKRKSKKPAKPARQPKPRRGYAGVRDKDGLTPRQRLDTAKAVAQEFENRREREKWQTREQAERAAQETAEMIQGDLYGTLPLALARKLSGAIFTPPTVRSIVRTEVDALVRQWVKGERVPAEAVKT